MQESTSSLCWKCSTYGLLAVGHDQNQLGRVKLKKNLSRFCTNFVGHPRIHADLFLHLQTIEIDKAHLDCSILRIEKMLKCFFMTTHFLAQYPTEEKIESALSFNVSDHTFQKHGWWIVLEIAFLCSEMIVWPEWWGNSNDTDGEDSEILNSLGLQTCSCFLWTHVTSITPLPTACNVGASSLI